MAKYYNQLYEEEQKAQQISGQLRTIKMFLTNTITQNSSNIHPGRLNQPTSGHIAAVFVEENGAPPNNIDIVIYSRNNGKLLRIDFLSSLCDPLCFAILFPHGDLGNSNLSFFPFFGLNLPQSLIYGTIFTHVYRYFNHYKI